MSVADRVELGHERPFVPVDRLFRVAESKIPAVVTGEYSYVNTHMLVHFVCRLTCSFNRFLRVAQGEIPSILT